LEAGDEAYYRPRLNFCKAEIRFFGKYIRYFNSLPQFRAARSGRGMKALPLGVEGEAVLEPFVLEKP
jgi:hypothetical protein